MAWETKVIRIHQDGTVDTDPCQLCKSADPKHRILWVSESDHDYDVRFEPKTGSPFNWTQLTVKAGEWAESKEIKKKALGTYTYHTFIHGTQQVAADPDVIIRQ
jgi:hypothetical protein